VTAVEKFSIETTTRELKHLLIQHALVTPPASALAADPHIPRRSLVTRLLRRWR
jgi:hypothetical protein